MSQFDLREYTQEEYTTDMQKLLVEKGLRDAVKEYCDKIDEIASGLSYVPHRNIQEFLCDILFLIELDKAGMRNRYGNNTKRNDNCTSLGKG